MIATSPATPARDRIYTTGQLAKICGVAPRTVSKWIDAGHMRGYKIPGSNDRRVPHAALLHFLRQNGMSTHAVESAVASVLYIGSDGAFCDALASALGLDLYDVRRAAGGFEAGVVCREFHPRAAVLDCALGTAEATAIAGHLRTRLPRVFLAAVANEDACRTVPGFDETFVRPADPAAVAARVVAALEGGQ